MQRDADQQVPGPQGLYDPQFEKDACGVGFVVDIKGRRSHKVVELGLQVLVNLLHRGACGCEANTGDGAGILVQMPDRFLRREAQRLGIQLPAAGDYGAGLVFLPRDRAARRAIEALVQNILEEEDLRLLGWRDVPTDDSSARCACRRVGTDLPAPVRRAADGISPSTATPRLDRRRFERALYVARKRIEHAVDALTLAHTHQFYVVSLSSNTLTYKGMLTADQIAPMFPDLLDPEFELGARARAPAVQHQHVSVVAAGPPVSLRGPQRRDQHASRQHQLDARA